MKVRQIKTRCQLKIKQIWMQHKRTKASKVKGRPSLHRKMPTWDRPKNQKLSQREKERNSLRKRRKRRTRRRKRRKIKMLTLILAT